MRCRNIGVILLFALLPIVVVAVAQEPSQTGQEPREVASGWQGVSDRSICIVIGKVIAVQEPKKGARIGIAEYRVEVVQVIKGESKLKDFGRDEDFDVQVTL